MGFGDGQHADLRGDLYFFGIPYGLGGEFSAGSWAALDPATGSVLWQVADPNASVHLGPITVAYRKVRDNTFAEVRVSDGKLMFDRLTFIPVGAAAFSSGRK